jgi:hypothetical protein
VIKGSENKRAQGKDTFTIAVSKGWGMSEQMHEEEAAAAAKGQRQYTWTLTLFNQRGTCWIRHETNAPFRAAEGMVCLYSGAFPRNPLDAKERSWDDFNRPNPWDTGQLWGPGWCAAWIAQTGPVGSKYVYFVQTPLTTENTTEVSGST